LVRIVSLVPGATEILYSLGAEDEVVGVTYACEAPRSGGFKEIVVRPLINTRGLTSREVDELISRAYAKGDPIYSVDYRLIRDLRPDLVVAQGLCEVCAAAPGIVEEAVCSLNPRPLVVTLHPHTLEDIFSDVLRLGRLIGREREAERLVERLRGEVARVARLTEGVDRKSTIFMEWVDPPFCSGHWVPEMVEAAGGRDFGSKGRPSRRIYRDDVLMFRPEVIICGPCGYGLDEALSDAYLLLGEEWVRETPAFQRGEIYAVDARGFFSRHGPSVVKGVSILAEILHPTRASGLAPEGSYKRVEITL